MQWRNYFGLIMSFIQDSFEEFSFLTCDKKSTSLEILLFFKGMSLGCEFKDATKESTYYIQVLEG
jgi:hypothetical protein